MARSDSQKNLNMAQTAEFSSILQTNNTDRRLKISFHRHPAVSTPSKLNAPDGTILKDDFVGKDLTVVQYNAAESRDTQIPRRKALNEDST